VIDYLQAMGARISQSPGRPGILVKGQGLRGVPLDLNCTPDALPMMAVAGCLAHGRTRLHNVAHARIKETDRIAVMCEELAKMGANIVEHPDGLEIEGGELHGAEVDAHDDHRVAMSLAVAGTAALGVTTIRRAEAISVTFPSFFDRLKAIGGRIEILSD